MPTLINTYHVTLANAGELALTRSATWPVLVNGGRSPMSDFLAATDWRDARASL
jgi:hypothetical protein